LAAAEAVYEDAKAINKFKGDKVLNSTLWSLFAFLLWIVAVPWYVFPVEETHGTNKHAQGGDGGC